MTPERIKHLFPNASQSTIDANLDPNDSTPTPKLERGSRARPLAAAQAQDRDTGVLLVRVTSYRVRLLDEDNLCEKFHVDCCRYAGILPSDAPDKAHIVVTQKKVAKKAEQKTLVEITAQ